MPIPYYEDDAVTLYHGDALALLPLLPKADAVVTDPPYGVEYDPNWRNEAGVSATARTGKVSNDDRADWREAWALFPGDAAYVWHSGVRSRTVAESLEACDFKIRAQIIWAKDRPILTRSCCPPRWPRPSRRATAPSTS